MDDRSTGRRLPASRLVAAAAFICLGLSAPPARAEIEGRYETKGQRVSVNIKTWGEDCGSRPRSYSTGGGKVIDVRRVGPHLKLGAQRTDRCWSRNPRVRRLRATVGANRWFVVCETPADDPRFEHGEYTLELAGGDTLRLREESRYDWRLEGDHCVATVVLTRTYVKVSEAEPEPPEPEPPEPEPPEPEPPEPPEPPDEPDEQPTPARCQGEPGPAVRLDVRPGRGQIGPGERICFRAVGRDAQGCAAALPGEATWSKARSGTTVGGSGGRLDESGCYSAADSMLEAEGRVVLVAAVGDLRGRATITIRSPDISDLIAARLEEGVEIPDAGGLPSVPEARPGAVQGVGRADVTPEGEPRSLLWAILAGASVATLLLAVMAIMLLRRRRSQAALDEELDELEGAGVAPVSTEVEVAASVAADSVEPSASGENLICPTCRRGFDPGTAVCPTDGAELMPYSLWRASRLKEKQEVAKGRLTCPECGDVYDAGTQFCPKDGSKLEPTEGTEESSKKSQR